MPESVGELLRIARTERGVTLEEASVTTRIKPHYIEALEMDNRSKLPSEVQGRGFLRLYAGFLDLQTQPLLDIWDGKTSRGNEEPAQQTSGEINTTPAEPPSVSETPSSKMQPASPNENGNSQALAGKPHSGEIFEIIGQRLRGQRESLDLKLSDIEQHTHVRQVYLIALEDGRINLLPSPVQGRGMLHNYATFLGLDVDSVLLEFAEGLQAQREERLALEPPRHVIPRLRSDQKSVIRQFLTPDLIIGAGVFLFLLIFAVWSTSQINELRLGSAADVDTSIAAVYRTATEAVQIEEPVEPPLTENNIQDPPNEQDPQTPSEEQPEETQQNNEAPAAVLDNAPLQLNVIARQRAFMRVITDNRIAFEGRVAPGNAYPFSANNTIVLLTGNAAALQVIFNQQDQGPLGSSGEVVSLIFSTTGIITPTPLFSPTPTHTPAPTITALPTPTVPTPTITPYIP